MKKCGNCAHFWVKNKDEAEIAVHAPHISQCQPGMPHCLGGQIRGACDVWQERMEKGLPMPWADGPMVESTFFCRLWERGGPRFKQMGSMAKKKVSSTTPVVTSIATAGLMIIRGRMGNEK